MSDCETLTVEELLALEPGAGERLLRLGLGYTENAGSPELREAVADGLPGIEPDHVLVHNAAVEVLLTVALAVLERGDHAVVHHPGYQAQATTAEIAGATVSRWVARPENGWAPDLDELAVLLDRPRTRLLIVTTPHNPTGHHFDEPTLRRVLEMADARGVVTLVDEAYRGTEYDAADRLPTAATLSPRAAALGLVSKGLGLPGLRVGWLVTRNDALRDAVARAKDYSSICPAAPSQLLAAVAVRNAEVLLGRTRARLHMHLELLRELFTRHDDRFRWVPPRAGPVTFPTLASEAPEDFARRLREDVGVLVVPGTVFDAGSREVRMGFGRTAFPQGLAIMDRWLTTAG